MFRELIAEYSKDCKYVRIQKPATTEQIKAAEKEIGCYFPAELISLLNELNGDNWLLFSIDEIINTIKTVREAFEEDYFGIEKHLFFAGNGCGDYYCYKILDGKADMTSIYMWEHETNETHKVASNITELIKQYYNDEI